MAHINIFIYAGEWKTIESVPSKVSRVFDKRTTLKRTINGKKSNQNSYTVNPMLKKKTIKTKNLLSNCNDNVAIANKQVNSIKFEITCFVSFCFVRKERFKFTFKRQKLKFPRWNFVIQCGSRIMSSHRWPLKVHCNLHLREIKLICFCLKISERRKKLAVVLDASIFGADRQTS